MLVHTDPNLKKAIILSFPRDLWVDIPGHGMDKINAAFEGGLEHGGPQLLAQTVSNLTGLPIDHYLYVDLLGFQQVVDALGGVDMCVPAYDVNTPGWLTAYTPTGQETKIFYSTPGHIVDPLTGLDVVPGCHHFDGVQALAYVRTRHLPCDTIPDFSRIGRQQQFLRSVVNQMLAPQEIVKAPSLVGPVLRNMHRDSGLLPGDLVYLVGQLRGLTTGAAEFRAVPGTAGWEGSKSVVHMDPSAREIFRAIRDGKPISGIGTRLLDTPPSEANVTVAVIDRGSGGAGDATEQVLAAAGFDIAPGILGADRVPSGTPEPAAIVYKPGHDVEAQVVSQYFPGVKVVEAPDLSGVSVAIVVGSGYHPTGATPTPSTSQCPAA
jgi:anionic cell wall polymer biosynthesis LytR-Cps2A-Psr (LCP) family protein